MAKRGLTGKRDVLPPRGCPDCGGAWLYVEGDVHYHQTADWEADAEGVKAKRDAYWEDPDSGNEGAIVERFLECGDCHAQWEL